MSLGGSADRLERVVASFSPEAGGMVMGTGIVSIALSLDGRDTLSKILLVICAGAWLVLGGLLGFRLWHDHSRVRQQAQSPAAFTGVAATEVLGTRLSALGWYWAGIVLLVVALILWLALLGPVLRHWVVPTTGGSLLLAVATESLAVLAATLAVPERARWLLVAALVPCVLGLGFYVFVIARFDMRQLGVGRGDQWITGGALAISTLAAGKIVAGGKALAILGEGGGVLKDAAVVLWIATMLWLPLLLLAELLRPRVGYDVRRWSTVFPFGMYAACSFAIGTSAGVGSATSFARVWVWIALAVWAVVFVAMLRRTAEIVRA
jgi:tellurite resistance protein TehA-like permease